MNTLVITHVLYRNGRPVEGPYSSVIRSLTGRAGISKLIKLPLQTSGFLGPLAPLKYLVDFVVITIPIVRFCLQYRNQEKVVIGIDPLSASPAVLLKPLFRYKLVFFSVDFSETRFATPMLQKLYELADEWSSKYADQVWVVSEALKKYKKENYGVDSIYIPNSFPFDDAYYQKNRDKKVGNKAVWTGSILRDKQITDIMMVSKEIQRLRPEMEFWFVPSNKIDIFHEAIERFNLKRSQVFDVIGQEASRQLVSQCDVGLALYDRGFGLTKFIGPIKIWEYMMCGLPFIISCEPSMSAEIKKAGVALLLNPDNGVPEDDSLARFIKPDNLEGLGEKCLDLAKKFDAVETIGRALEQLL